MPRWLLALALCVALVASLSVAEEADANVENCQQAASGSYDEATINTEAAHEEEQRGGSWYTGPLPPVPEWAQETRKTISDIKVRISRKESPDAKPREPRPDEPPPDPVREDIEFYAGVIAQWTRVLKENDDTHKATDKGMELVALARRALFPSLDASAPKVDRNRIRGRIHRFVHKYIMEDIEDD